MSNASNSLLSSLIYHKSSLRIYSSAPSTFLIGIGAADAGELTGNVLMLVLLEMAVEVGLLTKAAVAQVTLEGLLLVVDVANVALKVGGDAEGAIAVFTPGGEAER